MKVVILAGGFGTRLSEETLRIPKPMVKIGNMPILWHIMKVFSEQGFNEFIICLGYKSEIIKEFFLNFHTLNSDFTINLSNNEITYQNVKSENWRVSLINTGENTLTGGRILKIKDHIDDKKFLLTYGDGLGDINLNKLIDSHNKSNKICTVTAVNPPGRFGLLNIESDGTVSSFNEKPKNNNSHINGGFFVCEPSIMNYIVNDNTSFEFSSLKNLAKDDQLNSYKHDGFWKPMDTLRDKKELVNLWNSEKAPWKLW